MSLQTAHDVNVVISVPGTNSTSTPSLNAERRISPSWTIETLKAKLEPVTGIPPSCQLLKTRSIDGTWLTLLDHEFVSAYPFRNGSELEITDTRPPGLRTNFTDVSAVDKFELPKEQYEKLDDSVLAWKRRQKLGRFDPNAKSKEEVEAEKRSKDQAEVKVKGIKERQRCRVGRDDGRRGVVRYVGEIVGLGGEREVGCVWVGVELDEPVGRNDGSVKVETEDGKGEMRRVFQCKDQFGVFARPEKIEMGEWPPLDDLEVDEDMEEI